MRAGRELDLVVHQRVMGRALPDNVKTMEGSRVVMPKDEQAVNLWIGGFIPLYSTDMRAAWQVVDKISDGTRRYEIIVHGHQTSAWIVVDDNHLGEYEHGYICGVGDDAPLAICLAALKAVGYD